MTTTTTEVTTKRYGNLTVGYSRDAANNERLIPEGAATLEEWRADESLIPPWILDVDLTDPAEFARAIAELRN